jgi:lipoprotein NlpI
LNVPALRADFDSAIAQFQTALKSTPDDAALHYNLGLALKLKDQLPEALAELRKAEELDPSQPDVHYTLGVTLWQQGAFDEAVKELRAAISARNDYAEAHYTLGTVLKQQGKLPEAADALRAAIRLQPDFAGAHTTLASVLRAQGDNEGAAAEARAGAGMDNRKPGCRRPRSLPVRDGGCWMRATWMGPSRNSVLRSTRVPTSPRLIFNWRSPLREKGKRTNQRRNSARRQNSTPSFLRRPRSLLLVFVTQGNDIGFDRNAARAMLATPPRNGFRLVLGAEERRSGGATTVILVRNVFDGGLCADRGRACQNQN